MNAARINNRLPIGRSLGGLALLVALLPLSGCFKGFTSQVPVQQVFVLGVHTPPAPAAASSASPPTLQVLLLGTAAGLAGDQVVVVHGTRLDAYATARWASSAPGMLQELTVEALRRAGSYAVVEPDGGPFTAQYLLSVQLRRFDAEYGDVGPPTVHVALVCTLGERDGQGVPRTFVAESAVKAQEDRMQAVIDAFQQATDQVLSQLIADSGPPTP